MKKVKVDKGKCIGCGLCTSIAEKTFKLDDEGKAKILSQIGDEEEKVQEAIDACPVGAITWEEKAS